MKKDEINGVKVIHEFKVLHHQWECDGYGWVTLDGKIWLTNHGGLHEADISMLSERIDAAIESLAGIHEAKRLHKKLAD